MKTEVFHMHRVQKHTKLNENTGFGKMHVDFFIIGVVCRFHCGLKVKKVKKLNGKHRSLNAQGQKTQEINENTGLGEQVVQGLNENTGLGSKWLWEKYTELMTLSYFGQQTPTVIVAFISKMKAVVHGSKPHHEEKEFQMVRACQYI